MNRPSRVASTVALLGALTSMGTVGAQTTLASDLAARARRIHAEAIVLDTHIDTHPAPDATGLELLRAS
jgi:hypothetical protein